LAVLLVVSALLFPAVLLLLAVAALLFPLLPVLLLAPAPLFAVLPVLVETGAVAAAAEPVLGCVTATVAGTRPFDLVAIRPAATPPTAKATSIMAIARPGRLDFCPESNGRGGGGGGADHAAVGVAVAVAVAPAVAYVAVGETKAGRTGPFSWVGACFPGAAGQPMTAQPPLSLQQSTSCAAWHEPHTTISAPSLSGKRQYGQLRPATSAVAIRLSPHSPHSPRVDI
jgi:hypothetical protein